MSDEAEHLMYELQRLRLAYAAAMETAWHNHEQAELNAQAACGWAWDLGALWAMGARCYWCNALVTGGRDGVAAHTMTCAENPVAVALAESRAEVRRLQERIAAMDWPEDVARRQREACAQVAQYAAARGFMSGDDVRATLLVTDQEEP